MSFPYHAFHIWLFVILLGFTFPVRFFFTISLIGLSCNLYPFSFGVDSNNNMFLFILFDVLDDVSPGLCDLC
ncbi:hypothetical protein DsansV1_C01g0008371 [Dioscorea sansibarensis]